jgi:hypothetical protein
MKSSTVLSLLFLGLSSVVPTLGQIAENQLRAIFNNGAPTTSSMFCTSVEEVEILKAITLRRFLRADEISNEIQESDQHQRRKLTFYPASCKTACAGFATGTCTVVGCKGFRRELNEIEQKGETAKMDKEIRVLQTNSDWCSKATKQANSYLDAVINSGKVSNACIKLMDPTKRRIDCLLVTC